MARPYFEGAKQGHFRFGTLSGYRSGESGGKHRLSDTSDGTWAAVTRPTAHEFTGHIAGDSNSFVDVRLSGAGVSIVSEYDALVFCGSKGRYRREVLEKIRAKDQTSDLDCYVVLDTIKFMEASAALFQQAAPGTSVGYGCIDYVAAKETQVAQEELLIANGATDRSPPQPSVKEMIFCKAADYSHEEEFRVVGYRDAEPRFHPILSTNFPTTCAAFAAAVVDAGEFS